MLAADEKCIKWSVGGINLSPKMNILIQHCQTWNLTRIKLKGKIIGKNWFLYYLQRLLSINHYRYHLKNQVGGKSCVGMS